MATPGTAITQSDLDDLATLANVKLAPGTPYSLTGNLLADWQRIRDDLLAQVIDTPASPLYRSPDALVSDPQVVGVNPCPLGDGRLYLGDATAAMDADYLPLFKSVEFWFTTYKTHPLKADDPDLTAGDVETYADGTTRPTLMRKLRFNVVTDSLIESDNLLVTWTSTVQSGAPSGTRTIYDAPYTLPFDQAIDAGSDCRAYIELIFPIVWQGDGTAPEPTDSDFTYTCPESEQSILYVEPDGTGWRVRVHRFRCIDASSQRYLLDVVVTRPNGQHNDAFQRRTRNYVASHTKHGTRRAVLFAAHSNNDSNDRHSFTGPCGGRCDSSRCRRPEDHHPGFHRRSDGV
jgi:hypothetical protein